MLDLSFIYCFLFLYAGIHHKVIFLNIIHCIRNEKKIIFEKKKILKQLKNKKHVTKLKTMHSSVKYTHL